jgi:hypothetical protein
MSTRAITRTVRTVKPACGIIADMARALVAVTAWVGGTAVAVCLAWFGAGLVVRNTTTSPVLPVTTIARPTPPARPLTADPVRSGRPVRHAGPSRRPRATPSPTVRPSPTAHPTGRPSPAGIPHSYTLAGGQVTLLLTGDSARLVTAVPDTGFAVQRWSGVDWLRVDFTSGSRVSSLIASWNGHAPSVVTTN